MPLAADAATAQLLDTLGMPQPAELHTKFWTLSAQAGCTCEHTIAHMLALHAIALDHDLQDDLNDRQLHPAHARTYCRNALGRCSTLTDDTAAETDTGKTFYQIPSHVVWSVAFDTHGVWALRMSS